MGEVIYLKEKRIMKEFAENRPEVDALPGLELHDIVERMLPQERAMYKQKLLDEIADREKLVWLINEVDDIEDVKEELNA